MFAMIQFPICDLRIFAPNSSGKLGEPVWPLQSFPAYNPPHIRSFGSVRNRGISIDPVFRDEASFVAAKNGLRLPNLDKGIEVAFRRLWSDGYAVAKVEVGFDWSRYFECTGKKAKQIGLLPLIQALFNLDSVVPFGQTAKPEQLIFQSQSIAKLYARSTSKEPGSCKPEFGLVRCCTPFVLIRCARDLFEKRPKNFELVEYCDDNTVPRLAFGIVRHENFNVGVWLMEAERYDWIARDLRICLSKLHAEQEVLDQVLTAIQYGKILYECGTTEGEILERYLNRATRFINKNKNGWIEQSKLVEAYDALFHTTEGQPIDIGGRLENVRRQIRTKVAHHAHKPRIVMRNEGDVYMTSDNRSITIGEGAEINAPVVIADKIENSFRNINSRSSDEQLKQLQTELIEQIAIIAKEVEPETAQKLAEDSESLTAELAKDKPNQTVCSALLGALNKTAESIESVSTIVAKLTPVVMALF